ncbi:MAG: hypothetical protein K8L99_18760, partial [Anaerolineae bacterium]|nr:hypothetical protein [Anaerolineae bacterium]
MSSPLSSETETSANTRYSVKVGLWRNLATVSLSVGILFLSSCTDLGSHGNKELAKNIHLELVDWHIVGLWVINCPVCWIRVNNYNNVPIKNVCFRYKTFGYDGELLTVGTYTID